MQKDDYAISGGALKLKSIKGGGIEKKKKKDKKKLKSGANSTEAVEVASKTENEESRPENTADKDTVDSLTATMKTEAERKFEDARRKRLDERLRREGIKTHKERVEELNKYLSGLSEHHDMPRIGPG